MQCPFCSTPLELKSAWQGTNKKTERLRALRLAKEAADRKQVSS